MLSPGDRLGSYEVASPLGAGGMGEVYRARDTQLPDLDPRRPLHLRQRDGRRSASRAVVRFSIETRRLETIARVDGLRADLWVNLAPDGVPLVHRDISQHDIVVMDWEVR
jgi:serine/threonine protein kinase